MAIRTAWWMKRQPRLRAASPISNGQPQWNTWPFHLPDSGLGFQVLESYLATHTGDECHAIQYLHGRLGASGAEGVWRRHQELTSFTLLEGALRSQVPDGSFSVLYLVARKSGKVLQLLGHCLNLSPRFFNAPDQVVSTGSRSDQYVFFRLQFMEQYTWTRIPEEARNKPSSPFKRFRKDANSEFDHTWRVTQVTLAIVQQSRGAKFAGVCFLDELDVGFREGLEVLMTKVEDTFPGPPESIGVSELLTEVLYIVTFTWGVMLAEAETHLQVMSSKCTQTVLMPSDQLQYMRELHQQTPLWTEMKRRIIAARDTARQMTEHPFFSKIGTQPAVSSYLKKTVYTLEDHLSRLEELGKETNVLISLIFNISTLQDTQAAMQKSQAANEISSSVRRLSVITFLYLPLTLTAGIFGMNLREITKEEGQGSIWLFCVVSIGVFSCTVFVWIWWSRRAGLRA